MDDEALFGSILVTVIDLISDGQWREFFSNAVEDQ
jgi:hypothetical protein